MVTAALPVIQPKSVPTGSPEYETRRAEILGAFADRIPQSLRLPLDLINNPPTDVSGIPASCGLLSDLDLEITENYDAVGLAEAIASRKYTALTCCLTEWFLDEAVAQAKGLDDYLAEHGKTIGPLHGVPLSIKIHMPIAGTWSIQSCLATLVQDKEDCQMISILRSLGAVFYCKTNQPQTIMHLESDSLWGRVLNPYNIHLSAGGSTGGEAALIALKGSVLGIGTDIGGSIRGPSAFSGIYGFKPTTYTLPMRGFLAAPFSAELNVLCSTGPMCRSLRDMDLFMRCVLSAKPHLLDPRLRAIAWARQLLTDPRYADLVEIKEFKPYGAADAWSKIRRMYWPDGGSVVKEAIQSTGEPVFPLSDWIWKDAEPAGMQTAEAVNQMRRERDEFRCDFAADWHAQDVDVTIGPAFVGPASAHDTAFYWTYTSLYNFVDYPGVVVPTPIKTETGESYAADYTPLSDACKHVKQLWEESDFTGAPINLQIIARKYHDNELFAALTVLKAIFNLS
ncbi:unnamed protein product [Parascedosporium putredinis]|uniref:Amidase domain-containing protein n=1 Tax=Parascedosporium putredinis TaxID=1442378 RepID=A0A9P1H3H0_9PEZI|nr:unnamed protein product [Parascedosporium putredinis]CAI7997014.1 unnamed protein product [Parascedosporium putredinis]